MAGEASLGGVLVWCQSASHVHCSACSFAYICWFEPRPWLKEQVGRACNPFILKQQRVQSSALAYSGHQLQSQDWVLAACTNCTTTINPELLELAASDEDHSCLLLERGFHMMVPADILLHLMCCCACLECSSPMSLSDNCILKRSRRCLGSLVVVPVSPSPCHHHHCPQDPYWLHGCSHCIISACTLPCFPS